MTGRLRRTGAALPAAFLLLAGGTPIHAQAEPEAPPEESVLEAAATAFGRLWSRSDAEGITRELADEGIRLDLGGEGERLLELRQARAALRDFLDPLRTRSLTVARVSEAGGDPPRGFAEIRWVAVAEGTTEPIAWVLFVGFVREEGGWRLTEVRVLPPND